VSLDCVGNVCQAPTCSDSIQNEGETDVDCGGPNCAPCGPGLGCLINSDCQSVSCVSNVCL
jgi:hypothetical protein